MGLKFIWQGTALRLALLLTLLIGANAQIEEIVPPAGDICNVVTSQSYRDTYYIETPKDLAAISSCTTFSRGIALSWGVELASWRSNNTENNEELLDFGTISHIKGDLDISTSGLPTKIIRAQNLARIDLSMTVSGLEALEEIDMPALRNVGQNFSAAGDHFSLSYLPSLQRVRLASEGLGVFYHKSFAGGAKIQNTGLQKIDFLRTDTSLNTSSYVSGTDFTVQDNKELNEISLPGVTIGVDNFLVSNNKADLKISMPNLERVGSVQINGVKALDLSGLVEASAVELVNATMETITLGELGVLSTALTVQNSGLLTTLNLRKLIRIGPPSISYVKSGMLSGGDISIDNNPQLRHINIDNLVSIGGKVRINGPFDSLPYRIGDVLRSTHSTKELHLNSTDPKFDCTEIDKRVAAFWSATNVFPNTTIYTCITTDADGNDISPANPPISYRPSMSSATKQKIIFGTIGAVLAVVVIGGCTWAYMRQKRLLTGRAQAAREEHGNESVELGDVVVVSTDGGHARRRESGEQPPRYARLGKPGEVPPVYVQEVNSSPSVNHAARSKSGDLPRSSAVSDATTIVPEGSTRVVDDTTRVAR